jgi:PleD family two-component response regulator
MAPDSKETLLIVEDDEDVAEMLTAYFRTQGYEVLAVNWGEDAVKTCRTAHPDLVILDIRLPDINGFEVAHRLRTNQRTLDIPIIFLTEKREKADRMKGLELGADDYITKPFDIQELRLRVRNALRRTTQSSLTNPVTGLPEGVLVDERLGECLHAADWAVVLITLENFSGFRDAYGFVASDDVQRAVSLMIHNAVRDIGGSNDFFGQLGPTAFVLVTTPGAQDALIDRIRTRLEQSMDYFYPLKDRGENAPSASRLKIRLGALTHSHGPFDNLEDLKARLNTQLV